MPETPPLNRAFPTLENLSAIAQEAGQLILSIKSRYAMASITQHKSDHSPVTLADQQAQEIITHHLTKTLQTPFPILAEEAALPDFEERRHWDTFWLIDPLDGTREFIKGGADFTVNIALIYQKRPLLGVIYAPMHQTLYAGEVGKEAFKIEPDGTKSAIFTNQKERHQPLIALGSRLYSSGNEAEALADFHIQTHQARSSSLKFGLIAEGKADLYFRAGRTMEWDTAAGDAILRAAGGRVFTSEGNDLTYNKPHLDNTAFWAWGLK
ncbi:3'(2'),5'-bisphosphate nucleotidase CysQ [Hugenholtzia roseola]|uniref:3'(2'),5'-bisphosphate nucleotidase CysQ n=1 Tax=Hugenholtzia roseola TaxID=1002 RepID=UPI0005530AF0|nr:3'(2'),5'-bisphosphate nucleotidase CysQ [Hugenholtzia roseola]